MIRNTDYMEGEVKPFSFLLLTTLNCSLQLKARRSWV